MLLTRWARKRPVFEAFLVGAMKRSILKYILTHDRVCSSQMVLLRRELVKKSIDGLRMVEKVGVGLPPTVGHGQMKC